jgi:hypothetical protein
MTVREIAANLIKSGKSPSDIASELNKPTGEVARMLLLQIGEGKLTYADVLFTITPYKLAEYEQALERFRDRSQFSLIQSLRARGIGHNQARELELYLRCRDAVAGDMYLAIRRLEVRLHQFVRRILEGAFLGNNDAWWRNGVPLAIRQRCAQTREEDEDPFDAYSYTTLIDLKRIIDTNWVAFVKVLPCQVTTDKREFMRNFDRLNSIRNRVMHPTKLAPVLRDEYEYVIQMMERIFPPDGDPRDSST